MALSVRLQGRQVQSLVITPQLMQAIRLLQMSGLELERFVAAELEQNPLLEVDEAAEAGPSEPHETPSEATAEEGAQAASESVDAEPADLHPEQMASDAGPLRNKACHHFKMEAIPKFRIGNGFVLVISKPALF